MMQASLREGQARGFAAVVFDLDGTLIDSVKDVRAALNRALSAAGRRSLDANEMAGMIGHGARPMIESALRKTGGQPVAAEIDALLKAYSDEYLAHPADATVVFPGAVAMLQTLRDRGVQLGICTNKPHDISLVVLEALGLREFFGAVLGGDLLTVRKPDPEHLLATIRALGAPPEAAVYVGDSAVDVLTARKAGLPVIVVGHGYSEVSRDALGADVLIGGFAEFDAALAHLTATTGAGEDVR